jgi:hypothetical protein
MGKIPQEPAVPAGADAAQVLFDQQIRSPAATPAGATQQAIGYVPRPFVERPPRMGETRNQYTQNLQQERMAHTNSEAAREREFIRQQGKEIGRALPTGAAQKIFENSQNLRRAEQALALVEGKDIAGAKGDTEATGMKNYLFDALIQRIDKKGVDARAAIGDLGSLIIHDRSGAAVTAAEFPRLRPFIPLVTDAQETAVKKLRRFVSEYKNIIKEMTDFYKETGYRVPEGALLRGDGASQGAKGSGAWSVVK